MGFGTLQHSKGIMHGWEAPTLHLFYPARFVSEILPNVEIVVSAQGRALLVEQ